jgi:protein-disulfide isomerase
MAIFALCQLGACVVAVNVAHAKVPELPGVDLKDLDADESKILMEILQEQFGPCGKPRSFLEAVQKPESCRIATKLANYVVGRITRGLNKRQIVRGLMDELKRMTVRHKFNLESRPGLGPKSASVVVVEFFDFQCPHCRFVAPKVRDIVKSKKGVRLVYKQYPLDFHKAAKLAAVSAIAAHFQGKFTLLHDLFFDDQDSLDEKHVKKLVGKAKLDTKKFKKATARAKAIVAADMREGDAAGLMGTPSFFVNGLAVEFEELEARIDAALKGE